MFDPPPKQDPLGVMVVSPVSPSDPYTPTRFLKDHVATRLSDSPYMKTRAARRTSYAATLAKETEQKRRHRQQGVKSAIAEGEATSAKEVLQSTQQVAKFIHLSLSLSLSLSFSLFLCHCHCLQSICAHKLYISTLVTDPRTVGRTASFQDAPHDGVEQGSARLDVSRGQALPLQQPPRSEAKNI
jgi:hypothetical protein